MFDINSTFGRPNNPLEKILVPCPYGEGSVFALQHNLGPIAAVWCGKEIPGMLSSQLLAGDVLLSDNP